MLFSSLALAACGETIEVGTPPPPESYLVCEKMPEAPDTAPLSAFALGDGRLAYLKADVDTRDAEIARYIVSVRGAWFSCSNQLERVADYYEAAE